MKKILYITMIVTLAAMLHLIFSQTPHPASAVYFAENTILLYENGKRVDDSSVFHSRNNSFPVCKNGVCKVGQQYETVTFYKTGQNNLLNWDEWVGTHKGCEGFEKKRIGKSAEEINPECNKISSDDYWKAYMDGIKNAVLYAVTVKLPPPEGGEGCGSSNCIGGRIGDNRTLGVDLKKGSIVATKSATPQEPTGQAKWFAGF